MNGTDTCGSTRAGDRDAFFKFWNNIYVSELRDWEGWKPAYSRRPPSPHTYLREDRIPRLGHYAKIDELGNIICRIEAERFVLMMMPYLPLDRPNLHDVLVVDVDCNFDLKLLEEAGVPQPRYFVCRRRRSGDGPTLLRRPHLVYWLRRPILRRDNGRRTKAAKYYDAVREALHKRLKALGLKVDAKRVDLSKNPDHDFWDTVSGQYRDWTLDELAAALSLVRQSGKPPSATKTKRAFRAQTHDDLASKQDSELLDGYAGRNEYVFHQTRRLSYPQKSHENDFGTLRTWIHQTAHQINQSRFAKHSKGPLCFAEVEQIARSVADFVIDVYQGPTSDKDRGACHRERLIGRDMTLTEKQKVGGKYGAQKNAEATKTKVADAVERLSKSGGITVTKVAKEAGVSRPTARKWMSDLVSVNREITPICLNDAILIRKVTLKNQLGSDQVDVATSVANRLSSPDQQMSMAGGS